MVKMRYMSKNLINSMIALSQDEGLMKLLLNNQDNPLSCELPKGFIGNGKSNVKKFSKIIEQSSSYCRISPIPFSLDIKTEEGSFIKMYYQKGEFDNIEVVNNLSFNIDIIVAKKLWLIHDDLTDEPLIRPYEIMDRVIDILGRNAIGNSYKLDITDFQHLAVNDKFDSIRIYCETYHIK